MFLQNMLMNQREWKVVSEFNERQWNITNRKTLNKVDMLCFDFFDELTTQQGVKNAGANCNPFVKNINEHLYFNKIS